MAAEIDEKEKDLPEKEVVLKDSLLMHNNMFWTSTLDFHLNDLLDKAYQSDEKKRLIAHWLGAAAQKNIVVMQHDFPTDPLWLQIRKDGWSTVVMDGSKPEVVHVEIVAEHLALVSLGDRLLPFLSGMARRKFRLPLLFSKIRDHYFAMKIFFGG